MLCAKFLFPSLHTDSANIRQRFYKNIRQLLFVCLSIPSLHDFISHITAAIPRQAQIATNVAKFILSYYIIVRQVQFYTNCQLIDIRKYQSS